MLKCDSDHFTSGVNATSLDAIDRSSQRGESLPKGASSQSRAEFEAAIAHEFVTGSAIDPGLFQSAIEFRASLEILPGGDVSTPIHDILGWKYSRFGNKAQEEFYGAFFVSEDGAYWHSKLSRQDVDWKRTRKQLGELLGRPVAEWEVQDLASAHPSAIAYRRYTAPKGIGNAAYFAPVPPAIRRRISDRYGIEVPLNGSFWEWLQNHPDLPILVMEGGKKALCALSLGFIAVSVYGASCGLSEDLTPYFVRSRQVGVCFDQDGNFITRQRVRQGISMIGFRARQAHAVCRVVEWDPSQGKGFDDLVVNSGATAAENAIAAAVPFVKWRSDWMYQVPDHYGPTVVSTVRTLKGNPQETDRILNAIPDDAKLLLLSPGKSFGKTELISRITQGKSVLALYHRIQLAVDAAKRLGIPDLNSLRKKADSEGQSLLQRCKDTDSLALCLNSFQPESNPGFVASDWFDVDYIVLDEIEQSLWYLLDSKLLQKGGLRVAILRELIALIRHWASPESKTKLILADADLSLSLKFFEAIAGRKMPYFYLRQEYAGESYDATFYDTSESLFATLQEKLASGEKVFVFTSSQREEGKYSSITLENLLTDAFPHLKILRVDSQSTDDKSHPSYGCMARLNEILPLYDVVIASPSIETGVSFDVEGHFDSVFAFLPGNISESSARQALIRVRSLVPRHIYAEQTGAIGMVAGTNQQATAGAILDFLTQAKRVKKSLIREQLQAIAVDEGELDTDSFQEAIEVWAYMAARQNLSQWSYRATIEENLRSEGCILHEGAAISKEAANMIKCGIAECQMDAIAESTKAVANAPVLTEAEYDALSVRSKENKAQQQAVKKYELLRKFRLDTEGQEHLTPQTIGKHDHGWYKPIVLHYYLTVGRDFLSKRDAAKVLKASKNGRIFAPDLVKLTIGDKIGALDAIGFTQILDRLSRGEFLTEEDAQLQSLRLRMMKNPAAVKMFFGIKITTGSGKVKAAHTLLGELLELVGLAKHEKSMRLEDNTLTRGYSIANQKQVLKKKRENAEKRGVPHNPYEIWALDDGRELFFDLWAVLDTIANPDLPVVGAADPAPVDLTDLQTVQEAIEAKFRKPRSGSKSKK